MASERDIIKDAIIGTEKEIFADAFGQEDLTLDESGDRSLEMMGDGLEGRNEPEEDEDEDDNKDDAPETDEKDDGEKGEGEKEPAKPENKTPVEEPRGRVPAGRLREESEGRRKAEAERDQFKARIAELEADRKKDTDSFNAKFEAFQADVQRRLAQQQVQPQQQRQEPPKPVQAPNLFEDPEGFANHLQRQHDQRFSEYDQRMNAHRVEQSLSFAHYRHGQAFDEAFAAVQKLDPNNPSNQALVQQIYRSPNPGESLVTWHKRNEAMREIGNDPAAYRARIAEDARKSLMSDPEFRKQILADLRAEASQAEDGRPRNITRIPASLNRAQGGNGRSIDRSDLDNSDSAVFEAAWK